MGDEPGQIFAVRGNLKTISFFLLGIKCLQHMRGQIFTLRNVKYLFSLCQNEVVFYCLEFKTPLQIVHDSG